MGHRARIRKQPLKRIALKTREPQEFYPKSDRWLVISYLATDWQNLPGGQAKPQVQNFSNGYGVK